MAWKPGTNSALGVPNPNPASPDVNPTTAIGATVSYTEDTQGGGVLIYLPGVAGLVAGDLVSYDLTPGAQSVTRHLNNAFNNSGRPVAAAIGAPQAGQYGWFQIRGLALVNAVAGTVAGPMMATGTAGQVGNTADAGDQILGARIETAVGTPSAGKVYALLVEPHVQGQIT